MYDKIVKIAENISKENPGKILDSLLINKLGSEEKAKEWLKSILVSGEFTDESAEKLESLFYLDILTSISGDFSNSKGITGMLKSIPDVEDTCRAIERDSNKDEISEMLEFLNNPSLEESIIEKIKLEKLSFAKNDIATELGVNKRTLNKWLKEIFDDRFEGERKIYISDYFDIILGLSLKDGEDRDSIRENLEEYVSRLKDGLVFKKLQLVKWAECDRKFFKANMDKFKCYGTMDKFPYKIAQRLLQHYDEYLDVDELREL